MSVSAATDPDLILLIISSPSGAGKTTLTRRLLQEFSDFRFSVSHTTRQARANEVDGQDYHFVDESAFHDIVDENGFAEWASTARASKRSISPERRTRSGCYSTWTIRGLGRSKRSSRTQSASSSCLRPWKNFAAGWTAAALTMPTRAPFFDYMVVNDELQRALTELRGIILAEGCRQWRVAARAESLLQE